MDSIEITKSNLREIKYEDIMFFSFAEVGAMGEPCGIEILLKDARVFHTNYGCSDGIKIEDLYEVYPPLRTFCCGMCVVTNLDNSWKWLDMGFGNYLLVREEIMAKFLECFQDNLVLGEEITSGLLYRFWLDTAISILKNEELKYVFLSVHYEDDDISGRTYYYLYDGNEIVENDRVLVDRNGYETIGIVEKIELFNIKNAPFPIEKTKYIKRKVDENFEIGNWYDEFDEYEEEIEIYKKMFLNNMFNRLSIKRLIYLMFIEKIKPYDIDKEKLLYMPRMNMFFYKNEDHYRLAEASKNVLTNEVFRIIEKESIEIPREKSDNVYTANNFKKAVEFCKKNFIQIHDDTDALEFTEQKAQLNLYNKADEIKKFGSIDEIIEYLKNYEKASYRFPEPEYYIEKNKIIHYMGWMDYDDRIFELYEFLEKNNYIDEKQAFENFEEYKQDWYKWNIEEMDYRKANYYIVRLYNAERIHEGIINSVSESGKLFEVVKILIQNRK